MKTRNLDRVLADLTCRLTSAAEVERKVVAELGPEFCGPTEESLDLLAELVQHLRKRGVIDQVKPRKRNAARTAASIVISIDEARCWFLDHSSGSVLCIRGDGQELRASSFREADAFFNHECGYLSLDDAIASVNAESESPHW